MSWINCELNSRLGRCLGLTPNLTHDLGITSEINANLNMYKNDDLSMYKNVLN